MPARDGWSVCDRCGFDYKRKYMRKETTGFVVCQSCHDGKYDLKNHPQNRYFRPRRELLPIPDGRAMQVPPGFYLLTESGINILTETGQPFSLPTVTWTPSMSVYTVP